MSDTQAQRGSTAQLLKRAYGDLPPDDGGAYGQRGRRTLKCGECGSTQCRLASAGAYWQTLSTQTIFEGDHRILRPHSVTEEFDAQAPHTGAFISWVCEKGHRTTLDVEFDAQETECSCVMLYEEVSGPVTDVIVTGEINV